MQPEDGENPQNRAREERAQTPEEMGFLAWLIALFTGGIGPAKGSTAAEEDLSKPSRTGGPPVAPVPVGVTPPTVHTSVVAGVGTPPVLQMFDFSEILKPKSIPVPDKTSKPVAPVLPEFKLSEAGKVVTLGGYAMPAFLENTARQGYVIMASEEEVKADRSRYNKPIKEVLDDKHRYPKLFDKKHPDGAHVASIEDPSHSGKYMYFVISSQKVSSVVDFGSVMRVSTTGSFEPWDLSGKKPKQGGMVAVIGGYQVNDIENGKLTSLTAFGKGAPQPVQVATVSTPPGPARPASTRGTSQVAFYTESATAGRAGEIDGVPPLVIKPILPSDVNKPDFLSKKSVVNPKTVMESLGRLEDQYYNRDSKTGKLGLWSPSGEFQQIDFDKMTRGQRIVLLMNQVAKYHPSAADVVHGVSPSDIDSMNNADKNKYLAAVINQYYEIEFRDGMRTQKQYGLARMQSKFDPPAEGFAGLIVPPAAIAKSSVVPGKPDKSPMEKSSASADKIAAANSEIAQIKAIAGRRAELSKKQMEYNYLQSLEERAAKRDPEAIVSLQIEHSGTTAQKADARVRNGLYESTQRDKNLGYTYTDKYAGDAYTQNVSTATGKQDLDAKIAAASAELMQKKKASAERLSVAKKEMELNYIKSLESRAANGDEQAKKDMDLENRGNSAQRAEVRFRNGLYSSPQPYKGVGYAYSNHYAGDALGVPQTPAVPKLEGIVVTKSDSPRR